MRRSIMLAVLILGSAFAAAPRADAQEIRVAVGGERGFHAELGFGKGHRSYARVGYRPEYRPEYRPGYGRSHGRGSTWIPGCYVETRQRVWVPGRTERIWHEPVYEFRTDRCGNTVEILVQAGGLEVIEHPGHYEWRPVKTWRPGHWSGRRHR